MLAFATDPMLAHDRRSFQRLRLARPILGTLDQQNALILDIGVAGAFVEHDDVLSPQAMVRLKFRWRGGDTEYVAAYEEESDLEVVCRAYEIADEEGRQLIRLVAELSVRTVSSS